MLPLEQCKSEQLQQGKFDENNKNRVKKSNHRTRKTNTLQQGKIDKNNKNNKHNKNNRVKINGGLLSPKKCTQVEQIRSHHRTRKNEQTTARKEI